MAIREADHFTMPSGVMTSDPAMRGRHFCKCGEVLIRTPSAKEAMREHLEVLRIKDLREMFS